MRTIHQRIKIKEVFNGYQDKNWDGVVGYDGKNEILKIAKKNAQVCEHWCKLDK